jgi:hypothetical protein
LSKLAMSTPKASLGRAFGNLAPKRLHKNEAEADEDDRLRDHPD